MMDVLRVASVEAVRFPSMNRPDWLSGLLPRPSQDGVWMGKPTDDRTRTGITNRSADILVRTAGSHAQRADRNVRAPIDGSWAGGTSRGLDARWDREVETFNAQHSTSNDRTPAGITNRSADILVRTADSHAQRADRNVRAPIDRSWAGGTSRGLDARWDREVETFNAQHSTSNAGAAVFLVRCSGFDVECSMFSVSG